MKVLEGSDAVRFKEARKYIEYSYYAAQMTGARPVPICFLGAPGIGKTVCVKEAAQNIAAQMGRVLIDFNEFERLHETRRNQLLEAAVANGGPFFIVDLNMLTHEPMDFSGKPVESFALLYNDGVIEKRITAFLPTAWVPYLQEYPGILFIDEVTNIRRPDLMSVMLKMVGEHKVGYAYLNPTVMIILAGNRPEQSFLATGLPEPLRSRVEIIDFDPPLPHEWLAYAQRQYGDSLDTGVAGYLSYLASVPETNNPDVMSHMVTPRSCDLLLQKVCGYTALLKQGFIDETELHLLVEESANGIIGVKESGIFAEWYRNNMGLVDALRKGLRERDLKNMSPCGVWAMLALLGHSVPRSASEIDEILVSPMAREVLENLGPSIKAAVAAAKEHAPGILAGAGMFTSGRLGHVRASCGRLQFLKSIMEGSDPGACAHLLDLYQEWTVADFEQVINQQDNVETREINPFAVCSEASDETRTITRVAGILMASHLKEFISSEDNGR